MDSDEYYNSDKYNVLDEETIQNAVEAILDSREGRNVWVAVDDDFRVWDALVVGNVINTTCFELAEEGKAVTIKIPGT
jgi:hypothetical protein